MGKYLHLYSTEQEFDADYNGAAYLEPWVSLTLDVDRVDYNKGPLPPPDPSTYPLTIEALGSGTISIVVNNPHNNLTIRKNDGEWETPQPQGAIPYQVVEGDEIQIKATYGVAMGSAGLIIATGSSAPTTQFNLKGNIMSLLSGDNFANADTLPIDYAFASIFKSQTNLVSAENLSLPATGLTQHCYESMFEGCTSLTTAPLLPAETLIDYCYTSMFVNCTSLTTAPELPSTTLGTCCYNGMFNGCTSLEEIPELPATTLADSCYGHMFEGCTSLERVELPAFTLASYCCNSMFSGCTSLSYIKCLMEIPYNTWPTGSFNNFFSGLPTGGTFVKSPNAPTIAETQGQPGYVWPIGNYVDSIPPTWTIENAS